MSETTFPESITVTKNQFAQFIVDQPSDKEVDMSENTDAYECGCVMMQYAAKHLAKYKIQQVGFSNFVCGVDNGFRISLEPHCYYDTFVGGNCPRVETYADLQPRAQQYLDSLK